MNDKLYIIGILKKVVCLILVFLLGMTVNMVFNNNSIKTLQGYGFSKEIIDDNNDNSIFTDDKIYLESIDFDFEKIVAGSTGKVNIVTAGSNLNAATLVFKSSDNSDSFSVRVNDINVNSYIVVPSSVMPKSYILSEVLLIGTNSDKSLFSKKVNLEYLNKKIFVNNNVNTPKINLNYIKIKSTKANKNDKVYLDYSTESELSKMLLIFESRNKKTMQVWVDSLDDNQYFVIPSYVESDEYILKSLRMYSINNNVTVKKDFNVKLLVKDNAVNDVFYGNNEYFIYNNYSFLYSLNDKSSININASDNPIIDGEIFNLIKGTNKKLVITYEGNQFIINGKDVVDSKTIDVSLIVNRITENDVFYYLFNDGIILDFMPNGILPCKMIIRIKNNELLKKVFANKDIQVYYYNKSNSKYSIIDENVRLSNDNYYEFESSHNSIYILANSNRFHKVTKKNISFQRADSTNIMLISLGLLFIITSFIIILFVKKQK